VSSPYRESAGQVPDRVLDETEPQPLAAFEVCGAKGDDGPHGRHGSDGSGGSGQRGADAGAPVGGEHAGKIRIELAERADDGVVSIRGERMGPSSEPEPIRTTVIVDERGFIAVRAFGGAGGRGGNGGRGGDGSSGSNGSDATRWSSGGNGGDGGDGGDGGNATSGAPGGDGGNIIVAVAEDDTPLLMLLRHDVRGGDGGDPGHNGQGGGGGSGGRGGDSYSWTTTSSYTDSQGNSQTRTHYHSNSGGSNGSSGSSGRSGNAHVRKGNTGADGTFTIEVKTEAGVQTYASRYDLRLVSFSHDSLNEDCVYEPGELVRVFDLEVENVGGMPTPSKDELSLALIEEGWVYTEPGELRCVRGLAAGARHKVEGELRFRIAGYKPTGPDDPLEVEESILHRALLPSVRRAFEQYQEGDAALAGRFVIRFPARLSTASNLRSLAAGESTRVKFCVVNQSRFALGSKSACKRVLRVRVTSAAETELGDDFVGFTAGGSELAPSTGSLHEIELLEAGETAELELTLTVRDGAPEYRRFAAQVALELGALDDPPAARAIQYRAFDVRVARPFKATEADLLLVVNHRTTREEIIAWEALATRLAFRIAIWDLTRERHLDLEAPLDGELSLADWFKTKAIAILDNEIDGPDGPIYPHAFLSNDQALRAATAGIDLAYVGKGPSLQRVLIPGALATTDDKALALVAQAEDPGALVKAARRDDPASRASTPVHRRYWLRFWAKPEADWLARQAHALSAELHDEVPEQRHLVVHRFAPELASKLLWIKNWKVGTLETVRTLDTAAGAIVHLEVDDAKLHDPGCAASGDATTAMLAMFDFDENLERLRRTMTQPDAASDVLDRIADMLLLDLANEIAAVLSPGWRGGTELARGSAARRAREVGPRRRLRQRRGHGLDPARGPAVVLRARPGPLVGEGPAVAMDAARHEGPRVRLAPPRWLPRRRVRRAQRRDHASGCDHRRRRARRGASPRPQAEPRGPPPGLGARARACTDRRLSDHERHRAAREQRRARALGRGVRRDHHGRPRGRGAARQARRGGRPGAQGSRRVSNHERRLLDAIYLSGKLVARKKPKPGATPPPASEPAARPRKKPAAKPAAKNAPSTTARRQRSERDGSR